MLTEVAIGEFMLSCGGLSPKTRREYLKTLRLFERTFPYLPKAPQAIQAWLNVFSEERDDKPALAKETIRSRCRILSTFYKQTRLWHPRLPNPMPLVKAPRLEQKAMRTFGDGELHRLFSLPLSPRDSAVITLFLDTGARAQELVNVTWPDLQPGYVKLRGKTGERVVQMSEITYRLLQGLRPELPPPADGQHVFIGKRGPLGYEGIYHLVRRLCRQAGIEGRRCSPHTWRHTFGTNYAAADGCDPKVLQDILGHKSFNTTLRYIHHNKQRMSQNHQRCSPLRGLAAAAQGRLFGDDLVREAEEIVAKKQDGEAAPAGSRAGAAGGMG